MMSTEALILISWFYCKSEVAFAYVSVLEHASGHHWGRKVEAANGQ